MRYITILIALVAFASVSSAGTVSVVSDANAFSGYIVNDIQFDTAGYDWLSAILEVLPTGGGIHQDPNGGNTYSGIEYDTYVDDGKKGWLFNEANTLAPWDYSEVVFDTNSIGIVWYTTATDDIGVLDIARITLADTAGGTWRLEVYSAEGVPSVPVVSLNGTINGGYLPEPATILIMIGGGLGILVRRRCFTRT